MRATLEKLMLVEDDADIRTVAGMALEMVGGMKVCACESGAVAITTVKEFLPQLILLDVMMPGMSGPEVLRTLRQDPETFAIPVVFMTAKVQAEEIQALRKLGALDVIAKPFDPMTLADQVKATVEQITGKPCPHSDVKAWLERELGCGLRTWQNIFKEHGYIPTGLGCQSALPGVAWDEFADTGGYAHLITAASMWLMYLEGKRDWELWK